MLNNYYYFFHISNWSNAESSSKCWLLKRATTDEDVEELNLCEMQTSMFVFNQSPAG